MAAKEVLETLADAFWEAASVPSEELEPEALLEAEDWEGASSDQDAGSTSAEVADPVRRYLVEIGSYPLLTLEEEVELARLIWRGQEAAKEISALLNVSEEKVGLLALARVLERPYPEGDSLEREIKAHPKAKRLYQEVRLGEKARVDMVHANLRLVVSVAKPFFRRAEGLDFLDLLQEGNRGLIRATYTFDWRKRYKFSTYATWWIRQAIGRAIADQGRTIRLPVHFHEAYRKLRAVQGLLERNLGRAPTLEEIAQAMGEGWTSQRVEEMLWHAQEVYSLDAPVGEDEEDVLGAFLADEHLASPDEVAFKRVLAQILDQALEALEPRQAMVLRLRMGLLDGREYTLEEVGRKLGITRERVRQLEKKALQLLRHVVLRGKEMQDYLR